MKKFFAAICCTMMLAGSLMAQDATPAAPPVPVEDVASTPAPAPVAQSSVMQAAPYGQVVNSGCTNCGGTTAASMTYSQGCGCGQATQSCCGQATQSCCGQTTQSCCGQMTYTSAPAQTPCCGSAAPAAPVATDCCAPVDPCCSSNGRGRRGRVGFFAARRARRNTVSAY